ncbi:MAG: phosphogluconate dehydrogenase (NAD(+)-dependent, decarboxylating) [Candidatus Aquicultorales bacterium]
MRLGFIGLGRMGTEMAVRLVEGGHSVVAFDIDEAKVKNLIARGADGARSYDDLLDKLEKPAVVWLMLPAGPVVDLALEALKPGLLPGDVVIDGGNSHYKETIRRARSLRQGVSLVDVGTSGGIAGARQGANLTIGGGKEVVEFLEPLFKALAAEEGYARIGPEGAGHYAKMIHNGIEYALLEAYAEGFELLRKGPFKLDTALVSSVWSHGSVIRSWLLELLGEALASDPNLKDFAGAIGGGTTGSWAVEESVETRTAAPLIYLALALRYRSAEKDSFAGRVVSALRNSFGGHKPGSA